MVKSDYKSRLSVIIPGYNNPEKMWERCLRSVLAAIDVDDEVICVDDGSDEYPRILEQMASDDSRIRIIRQQNGGQSSARNSAVSKSSGRYVSFVDSDDEIHPETFRRVIADMEKTRSDIGIFGVQVIWPDINLQKTDTMEDTYLGKLDAQKVYDLSNKCLFNYVWNKVYDLEGLSVRTNSGYNFCFDSDGMPYEDLIFNLSLAKQDVTWCFVNYPGYIYYRTDRTSLSKYKPTNMKGIQNVTEAWRSFCDGDPLAMKYFGAKCSISDSVLYKSEWDNIWMPESPLPIKQRYEWLKTNMYKFDSHSSFILTFAKELVYTFIRKNFYLKIIKRWHILKLYPNARPCPHC